VFRYIPQHGRGTASLNVAVAASIVLYGFAQWANYAEAPRQGAKYTLANRPDRVSKRGRVAHEKGAAAAPAKRAAVSAAAPTVDTAGPTAAGNVDSR